MAELSISKIRKSYGDLEVIKGVDLEVEKGEFVVFVGPSGCGKSTLLRMIAGLEDITEGELRIGDELCNNVHPGDRGIAMVFQSYALYPHMNVADNIGFNLKISGYPADVRQEKIQKAAQVLQIQHLLDRKPSQLSGGQRQRVAIGRAIVREPQVFLFDEPLSNLDAALRVEMRMELSALHRKLGATIIYVTHDQIEAMTLADKIVVLDGGVVQQVGSPIELYQRPNNIFVAGFIGSPKMNFFEVDVIALHDNAVEVKGTSIEPVKVPADTTGIVVGDKMTLGIRPQNLDFDPNGPVHGTIEMAERLGSETILNCKTADNTPLLAVLDRDESFAHGAAVRFSFAPVHSILFAADGSSKLTA
ncbi:carbohydrate ABC transporter ATP-binding protein (CUT1 family) [Pacificibacter maritimus]|uniref:Carbohydrate ABC transporter ATP-binding protein (CUT1 family) n=1 Tax=Pacificibacter maritimus TaxID=762213 RepID=A0A3N4U934_9RHOB|nr:ABC transporter ATP-binding protein [Pacificibacter maritimus]RPE66308.1 carbohydrate ABC transporter ATP-binding protein (CUT1 family) [Pacificibacter maritimus]